MSYLLLSLKQNALAQTELPSPRQNLNLYFVILASVYRGLILTEISCLCYILNLHHCHWGL